MGKEEKEGKRRMSGTNQGPSARNAVQRIKRSLYFVRPIGPKVMLSGREVVVVLISCMFSRRSQKSLKKIVGVYSFVS